MIFVYNVSLYGLSKGESLIVILRGCELAFITVCALAFYSFLIVDH